MIPKSQIALIHVAKKALGMHEEDYRALLLRVAGVKSSRDLDAAGFDAVMRDFARLGFVSTEKSEAAKEATRSGVNASFKQKRLMMKLWDDWKGFKDPDGLRQWLENHFHVASIRFVSAELAPKVIYALKHFPARAKGQDAGSAAPPAQPAKQIKRKSSTQPNQ